jgi:hypothetical protein
VWNNRLHVQPHEQNSPPHDQQSDLRLGQRRSSNNGDRLRRRPSAARRKRNTTKSHTENTEATEKTNSLSFSVASVFSV